MKYYWARFLSFMGWWPWIEEGFLKNEYAKAGQTFGSHIFDRYLGTPYGYESALEYLIKLEREVIDRGYRAIPIFIFTYLEVKPEVQIIPLKEGEKPLYFAKQWKEQVKPEDIFGDLLQRALSSKEPIIESVEENDSNSLFAHELELIGATSDMTV